MRALRLVGYAERLETTRAPFREDPDGDWFDTRDLAYVDAECYLLISGRTRDVIIRGGENIPVSYVENVLHEHPDVDSVAVVAIPDLRLQERACACLVLNGGARAHLCSGAGVPRAQGRREAVLAREARTYGRLPEDPERQDPEVPASHRRGG